MGDWRGHLAVCDRLDCGTDRTFDRIDDLSLSWNGIRAVTESPAGYKNLAGDILRYRKCLL